MKIAINPHHKNKMPNNLSPSAMRNWWRIFNGGFSNFDLPDVAMLINGIRKGYAYTAQHDRYRKAGNFRYGQHVGLDFDTGDYNSSFDGILEDKFIQDNASFIHTTASHTSNSPRARVVFILDRPISSVKKYSLLTEAFAETYKTNGHADPSCKDPVRLFFGSQGCDIFFLGNTLTLESAANIVLPYRDKLVKLRKQRSGITPSNFRPTSDADWLLGRMVDKVISAPDGSKWSILGKVSRETGGYVGAGYFSYQRAFDELYQAIACRQSTRDVHVAEERIIWGLDVGQLEPLYLREDLDPVLNGLFN